MQFRREILWRRLFGVEMVLISLSSLIWLPLLSEDVFFELRRDRSREGLLVHFPRGGSLGLLLVHREKLVHNLTQLVQLGGNQLSLVELLLLNRHLLLFLQKRKLVFNVEKVLKLLINLLSLLHRIQLQSLLLLQLQLENDLVDFVIVIVVSVELLLNLRGEVADVGQIGAKSHDSDDADLVEDVELVFVGLVENQLEVIRGRVDEDCLLLSLRVICGLVRGKHELPDRPEILALGKRLVVFLLVVYLHCDLRRYFEVVGEDLDLVQVNGGWKLKQNVLRKSSAFLGLPSFAL